MSVRGDLVVMGRMRNFAVRRVGMVRMVMMVRMVGELGIDIYFYNTLFYEENLFDRCGDDGFCVKFGGGFGTGG